MAVGLVVAVDSVLATLVEKITDLSNDRCVYADLDKLVNAMAPDVNDDTTRYGCLLQLDNAIHGPAEPFSGEIWQYYFSGILMIRLKQVENIEKEMLTTTESLRQVFLNRPRSINNDLALVRVTSIERPITSSITDTPHYFLPFTITVYDK